MKETYTFRILKRISSLDIKTKVIPADIAKELGVSPGYVADVSDSMRCVDLETRKVIAKNCQICFKYNGIGHDLRRKKNVCPNVTIY